MYITAMATWSCRSRAWAAKFLLAMSAAHAAAGTTQQRAGREVQRLPVHRKQRIQRGLLTLGDLPRSSQVLEPASVQPKTLERAPGDAGIPRVEPMLVNRNSGMQHLHGANASHIMQLRETLTASLKDVEDVMYLLPAKLGTPPTAVDLILDTGSSDFWMKQGQKRPGYNMLQSSSSQANPSRSYELKYGQGEVSGFEGTDRFCANKFCLNKDTFIVATDVADIGNDDLYDGLLGLGFPSLAECSRCSFVQQVLDAKMFGKFAFGLALHADFDSQDSYIAFGESDQLVSAADEEFGTGALVGIFGFEGTAEYWMTKPKAITAGGIAINDAKVYTILDSGTSLLTVPETQYLTIWPLLLGKEDAQMCSDKVEGGQGQMLCTCSVKLNDLSLEFEDDRGIGSLTITLGASDLLDPEPIGQLSDGTDMCRATFVKGPSGMDFWLLGDVFLRRVYVIHDVQRWRLWLYPRHGTANERKIPYDQPNSVVPVGVSWLPDGILFRILVLSIGALSAMWCCALTWWTCALCRPSRRVAARAQAHGDVYASLLA